MPPMTPQMAAPMTDPNTQIDGTATGGYVIEIYVSADDKISVSVGEGVEEGGEEENQSVPDFREALKVAMDIYSNAGQIQDTGMESKDIEAGYDN